jgi:hypothetical protein
VATTPAAANGAHAFLICRSRTATNSQASAVPAVTETANCRVKSPSPSSTTNHTTSRQPVRRRSGSASIDAVVNAIASASVLACTAQLAASHGVIARAPASSPHRGPNMRVASTVRQATPAAYATTESATIDHGPNTATNGADSSRVITRGPTVAA